MCAYYKYLRPAPLCSIAVGYVGNLSVKSDTEDNLFYFMFPVMVGMKLHTLLAKTKPFVENKVQRQSKL
uniref:Uncharacterized protein n=1 Tax=Anguilla anguilla TaxID=7936 RepID=A0A0E9TVD3_ANGAN